MVDVLVGDVLIAGTSVGSTRGGVFLVKELETIEKMVDQSIYPQGYPKIREVYIFAVLLGCFLLLTH